MMRALSNIPRNVLVATATIIGSLLVFLVLFLTLGAALDNAIADGARLKNESHQVNKNLRQSTDDKKYVIDHKDEYEKLVKSDQLVPHTRRTAVLELQKVATERGLTAFNYNFAAVPANSL